jgi:hypothetical protein
VHKTTTKQQLVSTVHHNTFLKYVSHCATAQFLKSTGDIMSLVRRRILPLSGIFLLLLAGFMMAKIGEGRGVATASAALPNRNQNTSSVIGSRKADEGQMPIADFVLPESADPKERTLRLARGTRQNNRGEKPIAELPLGEEELPLLNHWWWSLPALPTRLSEAIVVGEVVNARAYLSSDKTGVYSEFTVRIDEALKNESSVQLVVGSEVAAERRGGVVRFPSGRLQGYSTLQQGMPIVGSKYLFFLKFNRNGEDFSILTGYELKGGRVLPLDGYGSKGEQVIPSFAAFEGMDETAFLKAVCDAIYNSSTESPKKAKRNQSNLTFLAFHPSLWSSFLA